MTIVYGSGRKPNLVLLCGEAKSRHERWLPVVGFEADYEVSSYGRVRRIRKRGKWPALGLMKVVPNCDGYASVTLRLDNQPRRHLVVHKLVLLAFVGKPLRGQQCRHLNGNKMDARLNNLRWGTWQENYSDMRRHKTDHAGERNGMAKLTESKVRQMRAFMDRGATQREAAARFGVSEAVAQRVRARKSWKHV